MKPHYKMGRVGGNERPTRGESWDSFTETKGNEVMGRFRGRQWQLVDWFILYHETMWKDTSMLRQHLFWRGQRERDTKVIARVRHPQPSRKAMHYHYASLQLLWGRRWLPVTTSSRFSGTDTRQIYLSYAWPHSTESWNLNEEKQKVMTYFRGCTCSQQYKLIFLKNFEV